LLKNYSLRLFFLKHESSHIGDELTIARSDRWFLIKRINVSWEGRGDFSLNDAKFSLLKNHSFKVGMIGLWNTSNNWYNRTPHGNECNPALVNHSQFPIEIWLQYQYNRHARRSGIFSRFIALNFACVHAMIIQLTSRHWRMAAVLNHA
jgi:hypothetical protein